MMNYVTGVDVGKDKRVKAVSNLLVLARESAGAELIWKQNLLPPLITAANKSAAASAEASTAERFEITVAVIRIISELVKNNLERTKGVLRIVGLPWLIEHLYFVGAL
jgi:hypothetical protein